MHLIVKMHHQNPFVMTYQQWDVRGLALAVQATIMTLTAVQPLVFTSNPPIMMEEQMVQVAIHSKASINCPYFLIILVWISPIKLSLLRILYLKLSHLKKMKSLNMLIKWFLIQVTQSLLNQFFLL